MAKEVKIIKEDVSPRVMFLSKSITTDCHFVTREDGTVDVARGESMVKIFDHYHDKKIKITRIEVSGGQLNPKMQEPTLS